MIQRKDKKQNGPNFENEGIGMKVSLPQQQFHLIVAGSILFVMLLIVSAVAVVKYYQDKTGVSASLVRGAGGDLTADVVLGKRDFTEVSPGTMQADRVNNPGGVIVDRSTTPNRTYVFDSGNNRILGYSALGTCESNPAVQCTSDSDCNAGIRSATTGITGVCRIEEGREADLVIGQPSLSGYGACNQAGSANDSAARADTLCATEEGVELPANASSAVNMHVDNSGNLYVPDLRNNRVLMYLSPFTTDTVADDVWGQPNFTSRLPNQGNANPTASSLDFTGMRIAGVTIDQTKSMWVTDTANYRVLRFPHDATKGRPAKTADLVFGQDNFTSKIWYEDALKGAKRFNHPAAVVVSSLGWVFVADYNQITAADTPQSSRILVFKPKASITPIRTLTTRLTPITSQYTNAMNGSLFAGLSLVPETRRPMQFRSPSSLMIDPSDAGLWVQDTGNHMMELWNYTGTSALAAYGKKSFNPNGEYDRELCANGYNCFTDNYGSFGIDRDGDLLTTMSGSIQDVWHFTIPKLPANTSLDKSSSLIPADARLMHSRERDWDGLQNGVSGEAGRAFSGIAVSDNQLIATDTGRMLFWNNPVDAAGQVLLTNGQISDGVVGAPDMETLGTTKSKVRVDGTNHAWVISAALNQDTAQTVVEVYNLPLTSGATPVAVIQFPLPLLGGGTMSSFNADGSIIISGLAPSSDGSFLWVADEFNHRVLRIRDPLTNPVVDVILGQEDAQGILGNHTLDVHAATGACEPKSMATADSLCFPGAVALDNDGNVFVSDSGSGSSGNYRILKHEAAKFVNLSSPLYGPDADNIVTNIAARDLSFSQENHMAFGTDTSVLPGPCGLFTTILLLAGDGSYSLDNYLCTADYDSSVYSTVFDEFNNLFLASQKWGRITVLKQVDLPEVAVSFTDFSGWTVTNNNNSAPTWGQDQEVGAWIKAADSQSGVTFGFRLSPLDTQRVAEKADTMQEFRWKMRSTREKNIKVESLSIETKNNVRYESPALPGLIKDQWNLITVGFDPVANLGNWKLCTGNSSWVCTGPEATESDIRQAISDALYITIVGEVSDISGDVTTISQFTIGDD